jgi:hypothetical protein
MPPPRQRVSKALSAFQASEGNASYEKALSKGKHDYHRESSDNRRRH